MPPNPTESDPAASSIAFDPMTVLAMHYQLNEKPFMLLQQGTEVSQVLSFYHLLTNVQEC